MLKDTDKFETSTHFTYEDYQKKKQKNKKPNKDLLVFASVFIAGLLVILGFAKILSPNVDVAISVDNDSAMSQDEGGLSSAIDERLHRLKMEDEGKKDAHEEIFSPELDEKVILPHQKRKTVGEMEAEQNNNQLTTDKKVKEQETSKPQEPKQQAAPTVSAPAPEQTVNAKVVVGYYASDKQAEVAKSIIQDAGLGVTPIVKNLGGYYTLQVGSYSTREKAQQAANNLLKSNFPARVIVD